MKLALEIPKGLEQTLFTVGGNLIATGISSVALIIISRYLGPSLFGEFSVGFALVMILNRINEFGLNTALFAHVDTKDKPDRINSILNSSLAIKLALSGFLITLGVIGYYAFGNLLALSHPEIFLLGILLSLITTYFEHVIAVLQSLHLFYQAVGLYLIQSATKLGLALAVLAGIKLSLLTAFSLYVSAPLLSLLAVPFIWPSWQKVSTHDVSLPTILSTLATAKHTAINYISLSIVDNLSIFFVQLYLSSYETGILGGVTKIALLFNLIALFLSQVLYPRVSQYTTLSDLNSYLKKASLLTLGILASYFLLLPFTKLSILLTIGPEFLPGLPVLKLLLLASFFQIAAIPFSALFFAFRNFWYFTFSGLLQICLILMGNTLVIPEYGLMGAGVVIVVTRILIFGLTLVMSFNLKRSHFSQV